MQNESILVKKLQMFIELDKLSDLISSREKYITDNKGRRMLKSNCSSIVEGDIKYISSVLYNSNPLYHLDFIIDNKNRIIGIKIGTDHEDLFNGVEEKINSSWNWKKYWHNRDEFKILLDLNKYINDGLRSFFDKQIFYEDDDLHKYFVDLEPLLDKSINTLKDMDFKSKSTVISICKENLDFLRYMKLKSTSLFNK